jgi:hypothetical protein
LKESKSIQKSTYVFLLPLWYLQTLLLVIVLCVVSSTYVFLLPLWYLQSLLLKDTQDNEKKTTNNKTNNDILISLSVQKIVCTANILMLLFVQQIYLCYCLYNKYVCTTNILMLLSVQQICLYNKYTYVIVCTTNILMLLFVQQIYLCYCLYKYICCTDIFVVQTIT